MKKAKKVLLLVLCAALLVGATVAGTLAWMTDSKTITNTFTVGNVEILLQEYVITGNTGKKTEELTTANQSNLKLVPGRVIEKNPVITVTGSEDCWLIVKVDNQLTGAGTLTWNTDWEELGDGYWIYKTAVSPSSTPIDVFTKFTCAETLNSTEISAFKDKTIVVTAYAIQKENVEKANALGYLKSQLSIT